MKQYDPMKDMKSVTLPRGTGMEENFVFVALNGRFWKVMRGVRVEVPRPVYDILMESERQQERQAEFVAAQGKAGGEEAA